MKQTLTTILLLLFCSIPQAAFSWDAVGHRVISTIAYTHLTPETKQKIDELTASSDPGYPPLARFLYTSVLPDRWRQSDKKIQSGWHFIDIPWSTDNTPLPALLTPNLISVLAINEVKLADPTTTTAEKANALAYVLHLVEDVHQPLHCITQVSQKFSQGDRGGNLFSIHSKHAKNLHVYWDQSARLMIKEGQKYRLSNKQIERLARTIQHDYPENMLGDQADDFTTSDWATESHMLAQQKIYSITFDAKPSDAYNQMQREIAARQMALAGYRLAGVLNKIFSGKGNPQQTNHQ